MASIFKSKNNITVRLLGDGPLQGMLAIADSSGNVRGYVKNPLADVPPKAAGKLDVASAVGDGEVIVSRELDNGESYTGTVSVVSGEIAEDLAHYLLQSEQIPSAVLLGVIVAPDYHVLGSGGLLLQVLPGAGESTIQVLEERVGALDQGVSGLAAENLTMEEYVDGLMGSHQFTVQEKRQVAFACTCSKEKIGETLSRLGDKEISELISLGKAETVCHFCNESYIFELEDLLALKAETKGV